MQITPLPALPPSSSAKAIPPIQHPTAVKTILPLSLTALGEPYLLTGSGDVIRVYDVSSLHEPELIAETDGHWHDVTALRLWIRESKIEGEPGKVRREPWVVSASLDGTLRRWKLTGKLNFWIDVALHPFGFLCFFQNYCTHPRRHRLFPP